MKLKRLLLQMAYDKARTELPDGSITTLAAYLNACIEERFGFAKNERTFVRYYKSLVVHNKDYMIDAVTLDQLSSYLGFKDYSDFNSEMAAKTDADVTPLKVTVSDGENSVSDVSDALSNIVIHITNSPVFTLPQFITQHKNGFGLLGILLVAGLMVNQAGYFQTPATSLSLAEYNKDSTASALQSPDNVKRIMQSPDRPSDSYGMTGTQRIVRKKECMYWNEDRFQEAFCDQNIPGVSLIALDRQLYTSLKKITVPDTLTVQNAIGKVWYDKSDNQLDFFMGHGLHPVNGKTLKPITKHIINKYIEESK